MGEQFDRATSLNELCKAVRECKRGVTHKDGPVDWYMHRLIKAETLQREILGGKYHLRPGTIVQIYRPKRREAVAPWFKDRVWQRSICNNGVYDDLTHSLCYDNGACQKGRGTEQAIRRTIYFLQRIYRATGSNVGWGLHEDIHKYFPSTPHEQVRQQDIRMVTEPLFLPYLFEIIDSVSDPREPEIIAQDPFGERGTGLGSQLNQLNQVALQSDIDHELKTFCKYSERYMDDFLILDAEKNVCIRAKETIGRMLKEKGLEGVDKGGIFRLKDGFWFLRHRFILTDTGKVIVRMHPENIRYEKRALKGLKEALYRGETDMTYIRMQYQTFAAQCTYCTGNGPLHMMDEYYKGLFREKPEYKLTRRHLHGNHQEQGKKAPGRGARERPPAEQNSETAGDAGVPGHHQ